MTKAIPLIGQKQMSEETVAFHLRATVSTQILLMDLEEVFKDSVVETITQKDYERKVLSAINIASFYAECVILTPEELKEKIDKQNGKEANG